MCNIYPKVSIVISTYNGERYIAEQLDSILCQSYKNIEIIISDDKSTDGTFSILKEYANKYPIIQLFKNDFNFGYIKNFEKGISYASGDYIALSDQDDWWHPQKIEVSLNKIKNTSYDLVYCNSSFVDYNLKTTGFTFSDKKNMITTNNPLHLIFDNCVSGHACLFKKSLLKNALPLSPNVPHDWWLAYIATLNNGIYYIDQELVKYRIHNNNTIACAPRRSKKIKKEERKIRLTEFFEQCKESNIDERLIMQKILSTYKKYSFSNNIKRVFYFNLYKKEVLKLSNRKGIRSFFFVLKNFSI